jgi:cell division protease FtsH
MLWPLAIFLFFQWAVLAYLQPTFPSVPYSRFLDWVEQGKVAEVVYGQPELRFVVKPEKPVDPNKAPEAYETVPIPDDDALRPLLRKHKVAVSVLPPAEETWFSRLLGWLIPPLIFVGLWVFVNSRMRGSSLVMGKGHARIYPEGTTGVKFGDVAGVDEARAELEEIVDFLENSDRYKRLGARIPKGVLLVGPPGTGKTLLARAVAGEAGVPFFSISGSEFIEMFVGLGAARVRELFEQAKEKAPCIVFIDELDALGKQRGGQGVPVSNDEREQTLNQLLTEMDGFEANTGVLLLAATNRPEVLDPALRRPGRFDRMVLVDLPDRAGREAILRIHSRGVQMDPAVDLSALAARTSGFSGADLANLINEAALLAARRGGRVVEPGDVAEAIERIVAGLQRRSRILGEEEKRVVAYHEVGHAVVGALLPGWGVVEKITIVPRGRAALGYTLRVPEDDRFLTRRDELLGNLATMMGGRAAETIIFGQPSSGAGEDLQTATDLAERAVTLYGMSEVVGPVAVQRTSDFLGNVDVRRAISPHLSQIVDEEIRRILRGAEQAAVAIMRHNEGLLRELAEALLQRETLEGDELRQWLGRAAAPPALQGWLDGGVLQG